MISRHSHLSGALEPQLNRFRRAALSLGLERDRVPDRIIAAVRRSPKPGIKSRGGMHKRVPTSGRKMTFRREFSEARLGRQTRYALPDGHAGAHLSLRAEGSRYPEARWVFGRRSLKSRQ